MVYVKELKNHFVTPTARSSPVSNICEGKYSGKCMSTSESSQCPHDKKETFGCREDAFCCMKEISGMDREKHYWYGKCKSQIFI